MNCRGSEVLDLLADEPSHVGYFYHVLKTLAECYDWKPFRVSPAKLALKYSPRDAYTEKMVRFAIKRIRELGLAETETSSRAYTQVEVYRLEGTVRGTDRGIAKSPKKQPVLNRQGTAKGTDRGNGLVVDVSSVVVDVLPSVLTNSLTTSCSDRSASSPPPAARPDPKEQEWVREVLFKDCPLYRDDPKLNAVDRKTGAVKAALLYRTWKQAFPAVDIFAGIRQAHAWEVANEKRRKVDRAPFLNRWLGKEQDRGGVFKDVSVPYDRKSFGRSYVPDAPRKLTKPTINFDDIKPPTEEDLAWMHEETVKAIGPCRDASCSRCAKKDEEVRVPVEEEAEELRV